MSKFFLKEIIQIEKEKLLERREKLGFSHDGTDDEGKKNDNWFGIALSGGGIRSATINLGFLKTLNKFGILKKADYLSTVSGGGYTGSYIQATLKETGGYDKILTEDHAAAFRKHGEYMIPGIGIWKYVNFAILAVGFLVSWIMSLISPIIVGGVVYYLYKIITGLIGQNTLYGNMIPDNEFLMFWAVRIIGAVFVIHFLSNLLLNFNLTVSKIFNQIETVLAVIGIFVYGWVLLSYYQGVERANFDSIQDYIVNAILLFIIGFFTNPNALSFHRYYRKQLADLFLRFSGNYENITLHNVFKIDNDVKNYIAPYPIINTCLNLQNPSGDDKFKGTKASDYFLLSPMFCGSKLTKYVATENYADFDSITLPAAATISAAAVNPGMGIYSSKLLSVVMTIFNARLGIWISNPLKVEKSRSLIWWPSYFFKELLGRIGTNNKMVNISDGGHIENLGVYELLRRGCRLVVAFDAGEDATYSFFDLNNLLIRARNELGLEIRFRPDQQPETLIRPQPSKVFSQQRFAIADIFQWWEDDKIIKDGKECPNIQNFSPPKKVGTFIYVKSAVTAPHGKPALKEDADPLKYGTYKYKIYHPEFPHESTADQFFDEIQWEAYYQLGQYIGADVIGLEDLEAFSEGNAPDFSVEQLIEFFDDPAHFPLFAPSVSREPVSGAAAPEDEFESFKIPAAEVEIPVEEVKYRM